MRTSLLLSALLVFGCRETTVRVTNKEPTADIVAPAGAIDAMVGRLEAGGDLAAGDAWVFARRQAGGQIMARGPHPAVLLLRRHDFWARVGGMAEDFAGSWGTEDTLLKMQVKLLTPRPTFEPGIVLPVAPKVILDQHRLRSRPNSTGKPARNGTRNRLLLIQSCFRNNSVWAFWNLQRMITSNLFHQEAMKKRQGRKHTSTADASDPITRLFGTVMPNSIPESTEWWKVQQKML